MSMHTPTALALEWRPVCLADRERYVTVAQKAAFRGADRFFTNLYIWSEIYPRELALADDAAFIRLGDDACHKYLPPVGEDLPSAVEALLRHDPLASFVAVTEAEAESISALLPDTFDQTEKRDWADYIYEAEALATLSGKKLHAKRNHINAFTAAHHWAVHPLTPADFDACREIASQWGLSQEGGSVAAERRALERALGAFEELELHGALLTVDDRAVAFTVGSMMGDTMDVHFEKTLPDFSGAYPVINREFVRMMREAYPSLAFVNREEDMGLENLRRAKLSYRPAILLRKFSLKNRVGQI